MDNNQQIKIRLKSFDPGILRQAAREIVSAIKRTGAVVVGPIPLPMRIEKFTLLSSPHINKKARVQYEMRTHKILIYIHYPTPQTIKAFESISVAAGVDIEMKLDDYGLSNRKVPGGN